MAMDHLGQRPRHRRSGRSPRSLFSWYLANFADYNATYGSLGAVIGFMMWTWISVMILIVGAELNAEMEHQTARDTTTGAERPMGARGAVMADTLGKTAEEPNPGEGHAYSARSDVPADEEEDKPAFASARQHRPSRDRRASPVHIALGLSALALMRLLGVGRRIPRAEAGDAQPGPAPNSA